MSRELLQDLAKDVHRLVSAGGSSAAGDEGLRRRAKSLRDLGQKVPVMAQLADAVDKVTNAEPKQATRGLLDLLPVVRQVLAGIATVEVKGEMLPVAPAGSWKTATQAHDLYPLIEALQGSGTGRLEVLKNAVERGVAIDLRLLDAYLNALEDGFGELADYVAETVLPAFGPSVLGDIEQKLDLDGNKPDGRRLLAIVRIDPKKGAELCLRSLKGKNSTVQLYALRCLKDIALTAELKEVVLGLTGGKRKAELRTAAIQALGELGAAVPEAVGPLIEAIRDKALSCWRAVDGTSVHRHPAAEALGRIGQPAVQALVALLQDEDEMVRLRAVEALAVMAPPAQAAVPALIPLLEDKKPEIRQATMSALAETGKNASAAVPALVQALKDKSVETRTAAACALYQISGDTKQTIPVLVESLNKKDAQICRAAGRVLQSTGKAAEPAIPPLIELLNGGYAGCAYVQYAAVDTLKGMGKQLASVAEALVDALERKDHDVRRWAGHILNELGPAAKAAIPVYVKTLKDKSWENRQQAAQALGENRSDPKTAVAALAEALKDKHERVRQVVAFALNKYGSQAKAAIPALKDALDEKDQYARQQIASALAEIETAQS